MGVSRLWRCALTIGDQGVVWAAPCLWDCWAGRRGWRCVILNGVVVEVLVRVIAVLVRVAAGVLASRNGSFFKGGLVQN